MTARYAVTAASATGFTVELIVANSTPAAQSWTVVLTYPAGTEFTVTGSWGAPLTVTTPSLTFQGDPLPAGASSTVGFQAETAQPTDAQPSACTINDTPCTGL